MVLSRLVSATLIVAVATGMTILACGDDGGGTMVQPDAKVFMDAPPPMGLMGLGQECSASAPCPANAMECISITAGGAPSKGYCTPKCLTGGAGTTNGSAQLTTTTPAPNQSTCTGAYTGGTVGQAACAIILTTTPMHSPLMANTSYTAIDLGCVVACTTGMCPPLTVCKGMAGSFPGFCVPQ